MSGYGKRAMHHGDIRVTMSVYGEPVNDVFKDASSKNCRAGSQSVTDKSVAKLFKSGVGNGNRTRNRRSHSPVLCQLSYSHRHGDYTTAVRRCGGVCNREGHDRFPFAQRQGIGCRHLASAALEAVVGAITPQPSNGNTRSETNKPDRKK